MHNTNLHEELKKTCIYTVKSTMYLSPIGNIWQNMNLDNRVEERDIKMYIKRDSPVSARIRRDEI